MRILPNGLVEIKNFDTNEVKQVKPEELPNYGISIDAYKEMRSVQPGGSADIQTKLQNVDYMKKLSDLTASEYAKKNPLNLSHSEGQSAIKEQQDAMNEDFKATGGLRQNDIKEFYRPYVAEEQSTNITKGKEKLALAQSARSLDQVLTMLDELKDLTAKYSVLDVGASKLGLSSAEKIFNQKKALITQQLAKLAEYGKQTGGRGISDQDRKFYQEEVTNLSPIGLQGPIDQQIEELKSDVIRTSGFDPSAFQKPSALPTIGSSVVMTGPDGKKYNVPADKVELFKQNGYK